MKKMTTAIALVATIALFAGIATAQDGKELMEKALKAYYYPGNDGKAEITMNIGESRTKEFVMLRLNIGEAGGNQKFFIYFKQPNDERETTFMVYKNIGKDDERWLFVPSVKLINRIAPGDKRSSFVGSDFAYEDVSGRSIDQDTHTFEKEEAINGRDAYVVKSVPTDGVEYAHKLTWIDKENFLPLQEKYFDAAGTLMKSFNLEDIKDVDGFPTPMKRIMKDEKSGRSTVINIDKASYNLKLKEKDFSERKMRRPPRGWIR